MKSGVDYWKGGLEIVKADAVTWIVGTLLCMIANIIPGCGLVSFFYMAQKAKRGEKVEYGDAFYGFQKLVPSLLAGLIFSVPFMLCVIPGLYFGPLMIYAFPMIASGKEEDGIAAIKASMAKVKESGAFGDHFVRWLLISILGGIGSIACGIGQLFTLPCAIIGWNDAYDDLMAGA